MQGKMNIETRNIIKDSKNTTSSEITIDNF
jgi:hypothetical protein